MPTKAELAQKLTALQIKQAIYLHQPLDRMKVGNQKKAGLVRLAKKDTLAKAAGIDLGATKSKAKKKVDVGAYARAHLAKPLTAAEKKRAKDMGINMTGKLARAVYLRKALKETEKGMSAADRQKVKWMTGAGYKNYYMNNMYGGAGCGGDQEELYY